MRIKSILRCSVFIFCILILSQLFVVSLCGDDYSPLGADVQLTDHPATQSGPVISWSGEYYGVIWRDNRVSYWPIYYTVVGPNGEKLMEETMLSGVGQFVTEKPSITWNEQEQVFAVTYQVGEPADIYFVTFDEQGTKTAPYRVTNDSGDSGSPAISWNGEKYGLAWFEYGNQIRFTCLSPSGVPLYSPTTISTQSDCRYPSIAWNNITNEFGVVYNSPTDGKRNLFFVIVDVNGSVKHTTQVTNTSGWSEWASLVFSGQDYAMGWQDDRYGNYEVLFSRLDSDGNILDPVPVRISNSSTRSGTVSLIWTGGEYGVGYSEIFPDNTSDVYFARLDSNGIQLGGITEVTNTVGPDNSPKLSWNGLCYAVTWHGMHTDNYDIYWNLIGDYSLKMVTVSLKDSSGQLLDSGSVQYYDNGWLEFGTTTGGQVSQLLPAGVYSFRMTYGGYTQQLNSVDVGVTPNVEFQTVPVTVRLQDHSGNLMDSGTVMYYADGWKIFGQTQSGEVSKELLPGTYSFRLTYEGYTQQKNNVSVSAGDSVVEFQTVLATVNLKDHNGNLTDSGTVLYYANGWLTFGQTQSGQVSKELLPGTYSFRMTYEGYTQQKNTITISAGESVVDFKTVLATVNLKDHNGNLMDSGTVLYYANGWLTFGQTQSGQVSKELLPGTYSFRMTYAGYTQQKNTIAISAGESVVDFQTVLATVNLKDHNGILMDLGTVLYYANGWLTFGQTQSGQVSKELLPGTYSFRMTYEGYTQQKNSITVSEGVFIDFQAIAVTVKLSNSLGEPLDTGIVQYYAGSWLSFGETMGGQVSKDMLPGVYSFRMTYNGITQQKNSIDVGITPIIEFITQ